MSRRIFKWIWIRKFMILALIALSVFFWFAPESIAGFVSGMFWGAGITGFLILHFFKVQKKMPVRWTCPREGCYYHIETENGGEMMVLEVAEKHEHDHEIGLIDGN